MAVEYEILSRDSLIRMLTHAIGKEGCLGDKTNLSRLINFLVFDAETSYCKGYAPPSVIRRELSRAKNMGIINIDDTDESVAFTEESLRHMEENKIADGVNPKFHQAAEMERKGMAVLAANLRHQVSIEGLFWFPPEWKPQQSAGSSSPVQPAAPSRGQFSSRPAPQRGEADPRVTKKPMKPVKLG